MISSKILDIFDRYAFLQQKIHCYNYKYNSLAAINFAREMNIIYFRNDFDRYLVHKMFIIGELTESSEKRVDIL